MPQNLSSFLYNQIVKPIESGGLLYNAAEPTTVSATAATGTINFDINTQSVLYYTSNASANWTTNLRYSSAYYNNVLQVDGTTVTPKWQGGTAPSSGNASAIDIYTYTVIKTADRTFTVLASQTKFA